MLTTLLFRPKPELIGPIVFRITLMVYLPLGLGLAYFSWFTMSILYQSLSLMVLLIVLAVALVTQILSIGVACHPLLLVKASPQTYNLSQLMTFDEEGVTSRAESGSHSFIVWTDFIGARDHRGLTVLYQTKFLFHPVPHTAWPSQVERDQFLALLASKGLLK